MLFVEIYGTKAKWQNVKDFFMYKQTIKGSCIYLTKYIHIISYLFALVFVTENLSRFKIMIIFKLPNYIRLLDARQNTNVRFGNVVFNVSKTSNNLMSK